MYMECFYIAQDQCWVVFFAPPLIWTLSDCHSKFLWICVCSFIQSHNTRLNDIDFYLNNCCVLSQLLVYPITPWLRQDIPASAPYSVPCTFSKLASLLLSIWKAGSEILVEYTSCLMAFPVCFRCKRFQHCTMCQKLNVISLASLSTIKCKGWW